MKLVCSASLILIFIAFGVKTSAQPGQDVSTTILHLDSAFWKAYNTCDTAQLKNFIADDVEFYHDKGGITTGAPALIESIRKNLCGGDGYRLRREAVTGSVKVYPMKNNNEIYGAVISGEHVFYVTANGKPEYLDGQANFTHLWLLKNGKWKMTRILSYNHRPAEYKNTRKEIELPSKQLETLAGTYKSAQSGTMNIVIENNVLILQGGNNRYLLYPLSDTLFFTKERDLTFEFIKDATGNPVKMVVNEHGAKVDELMFEK
ncbi:MAG: DUF4440 domain-containing protein [Ginsengibacter sp.]